jgi:hypothetical protein
MKKPISFKKLKLICVFEDASFIIKDGIEQYYNKSTCTYKDAGNKFCCSKNCPIWKGLKGLSHDRP